jgi:hypothetical protein
MEEWGKVGFVLGGEPGDAGVATPTALSLCPQPSASPLRSLAVHCPSQRVSIDGACPVLCTAPLLYASRAFTDSYHRSDASQQPGMTRDDLFNINAGIVRDLAQGIAEFCPKAYVSSFPDLHLSVPLADLACPQLRLRHLQPRQLDRAHRR